MRAQQGGGQRWECVRHEPVVTSPSVLDSPRFGQLFSWYMQVASETQCLRLEGPSKTFQVERTGHSSGIGAPAGRIRRRRKEAKWYDNSYHLLRNYYLKERAGFTGSPTGTRSHLVGCSAVTTWKSFIVSSILHWVPQIL